MQRHDRLVHGSSKDAPRPSSLRVTDKPVPEAGAARQATGENEIFSNAYQTIPTDATTSK